MWCWVKFVVDNSEIMRPLEFFENFETIELEKNKEYQVFWSKEDTDTPEKLLRKEGKILHVDNIKKGKNTKNPIPGYYRAVLLQFADTVEKLERTLNEKRVSVPLKIHSGNEIRPKKEKTSKEKMIQNSRKRNISVLIGESENSQNLNSLNQEVIELKTKLRKEANSKMEALEKLEKLEKRHKSLEEEMQIVKSLNYDLQRKLITTVLNKPASTSTFIESGQTSTPVSSPIKEDRSFLNTKEAVDNEIMEQSLILYEEDFETPLNVQNFDATTIPMHTDVQKTPSLTLASYTNEEECDSKITEEIPIIVVPPASAFRGPLSYPNNCMVTRKQYETAKKTIKIGEYGDSQFTKNLADILWEREVLALRSVTGARSRKKGIDGIDENEEKSRPACTPEKRTCIKQLFNFRMDEEEVELKKTLSKENRLTRVSKINKYLKAKIGTVRLQLGLK